MPSIGSLVVNVVAQTSGFKKGMREARAELGLFSKFASGVGKVRFFGGMLGGVALVRGTIRGLRDDMKHLSDFTAEEAAGIREANQAIDDMNKAWKQAGITIRKEALPAINAILGATRDIVTMKGVFGSAGTTTSGWSSMYDAALGKMSDADFRAFQARFGKQEAADRFGIGEFVERELGISRFDVDKASFVTAMQKRQSSINESIAKRHDAAGVSQGKDWKAIEEGAKALRMLGHLFGDARAFAREGDDPMGFGEIFESKLPKTPKERRLFQGGFSDRGFSAMEAGTAEAFRQERLSANQFVDNQKQQLKVAEKQLDETKQLKEAVKQQAKLEVVNLT